MSLTLPLTVLPILQSAYFFGRPRKINIILALMYLCYVPFIVPVKDIRLEKKKDFLSVQVISYLLFDGINFEQKCLCV